MTELTHLEGPRPNQQTIYTVVGIDSSLKAIFTSETEATHFKNKHNHRTTREITVKNGDAHIGDTLWVLYETSFGKPAVAFHDKQTAREILNKHNGYENTLHMQSVTYLDTTTWTHKTRDDLTNEDST